MDIRLTALFFVVLIIAATAYPSEDSGVRPSNVIREKRDATDTVKTALNDAAKTMSEAGDAVVNAFKPTEKSTVDKIADGVKNLGQ